MTVRLLVRLALAAVVTFAAASARAEEKVVNVYNWSDYIAKDTLEKFTRETGITVKYDTYGENEILDAKLMTGKSGYDVVFPSASPFFARQVKAGLYQPLDLAKIPNAKGVDKAVMDSLAKVDQGGVHALPYMMAATGIGYNVDAVAKAMPGAPVDSWRMLFDPAVVSKLKSCGVTLLDTPVEVIPAMLAYLGRDPTVQTTAELDVAMKALAPLRPDYRYLHSEKYRSDLANGDICVAQGYVGDLVQARARAREAAGHKQNIAIVIPKEGALVNIDVMAVPVDAPHPDAAMAFINFILRPDIIAEITNQTGYANAVPAALAYGDPAIRSDPAIYPPPDVKAKLFSALPPATPTFDRTRTRAWSRFRADRF
ncbi:MAG: extracellular solute-binding protein [Magnetospirillum sp.]|nr:extracellular solute-binding protein [Magnetospirillum sp.]